MEKKFVVIEEGHHLYKITKSKEKLKKLIDHSLRCNTHHNMGYLLVPIYKGTDDNGTITVEEVFGK